MKLLLLAVAAAALPAGTHAGARVPAPCDDARAVETVRAAAARERVDVSAMELAVEGPYGRAKFVRTHPTFPPGPASRRKLAGRTFWFVWFHPPFRAAGTRASDLWALVDAARCEVLHLAPPR